MISSFWQWVQRLPKLLTPPRPEPFEHARNLVALQRHIVLPVRLVAVAVAFHQIYESPWLGGVVNLYAVVFETIQRIFDFYALFTVAMSVVFYVVRRLPPAVVQWLVFVMGLADGVFLAGLTVLTGGFESILYWVFPAVIVLNAISIPLATPQIVLNLLLSVSFLVAGLVETSAPQELSLPSLLPRRGPQAVVRKLTPEAFTNLQEIILWLEKTPEPLAGSLWRNLSDATHVHIAAYRQTGQRAEETRAALAADLNRLVYPSLRLVPTQTDHAETGDPTAGPYVVRVSVLVLLSFCCYGVQVLVAGRQRAEAEQREYRARTSQLHAAGRLAAEFAHQIKNPLAIITNVTFSLQKSLKTAAPEAARQAEIIREEVAKADRIITQIMGYAQLSEGRVERLDVLEELDCAIEQVFPRDVPTGIEVRRDCMGIFPTLFMQRRHLLESLVNVLQNAREALDGKGQVEVQARCHADDSVEITIGDNGPGVAPDKLGRIFEAYYTTKPRGTGLGLAVVKHNVELYGGTIRVESGLGTGTKFILLFPAKMLPTPADQT